MKKIARSSPLLVTAIFIIGYAAILTLFIVMLETNESARITSIIFILVLGGLLSLFLFRYYVIAYGYHLIDDKVGSPTTITRIRRRLLIFALVYLVLFINEFLLAIHLSEELIEIISYVVGITALLTLIGVVVPITESSRFYLYGEEARLRDYVFQFLLLCIPFGLTIMHARLRVAMKQNGIIAN